VKPFGMTAGRSALRAATVALALLLCAWAGAQTRSPDAASAAADANAAEHSVNEWLARMHEASRRRTYVGTYVISAGNTLSSARIWHACDGAQQVERVESLTGAPRSTFRHNDQVLTFLSDSRVVVAEQRESLAFFRNLLQANDSSIAQFYLLGTPLSGRVAGLDADVLELRPKDALRFGYRVWTEKKSGLVIKLQTLDRDGSVLEQSAFTELQLDASVNMAKLIEMMGQTAGYQVERPELVKTVAASEGWVLKNPVPGFRPVNCVKRTLGGVAAARQDNTLQWIFSDGLASVSLFVDAFDPRRHGRPAVFVLGATHTLTRRIGDWWLTAVGEVPTQTLTAFAQGLERTK
jgi:sigma-E factor negative regulatory protein RseB